MTTLENRTNLRKFRHLLGVSQESLAREIGVSLRTYSRYESLGPTLPILRLVEHMAEKFIAHQTATTPDPVS
jgi:transcriptional regulator with XRE-family HTH domain